MDELAIRVLFAGLTVGATYGINAVAITLVYRVSGIINLSQGEFVTLGALAAIAMHGRGGLPQLAAIGVAIFGVSVLGYGVSRLVFLPAQRAGRSVVDLLIITLAVAIVGQGIAFLAFGRNPYYAEPVLIAGQVSLPGGVAVSGPNVLLIVATVTVGIALAALFGFTMLGKSMSASADNRKGARAIGIDVDRMLTVALVGAAALGALSGILLAPITSFHYLRGFQLAMLGLAAAMLAGMRSPFRALVAGITIGLLETSISVYISSTLQTVVVFTLLITVVFTFPGVVEEEAV